MLLPTSCSHYTHMHGSRTTPLPLLPRMNGTLIASNCSTALRLGASLASVAACDSMFARKSPASFSRSCSPYALFCSSCTNYLP